MSQRSNNKNIIQIAVGAACLAGAWYYGQISSAGKSPDLKAERPPLKAEDLVWDNLTHLAPPLASATSANLAQHMNQAVPELSADRNLAGNGNSPVDMPVRQGPMIVEPDFSGMEKSFGQKTAGTNLASITRDQNTAGTLQPLDQRPTNSSGSGIAHDQLASSGSSGIGLTQNVNSNIRGNGEVSVLAKPALADNANSGIQVMAPVSSRASSGISTSTSGFRMHVVRPGETLQSLSREYFGTPDFYLDIYVANQDVLTSPGAVRNGMSLRIPLADNE